MSRPVYQEDADQKAASGRIVRRERSNSRLSCTLRVLAYHRIADPQESPALDPRLISATPGIFARQMLYLTKRYHPVSMEEVLDAVEYQTCLPNAAVLITFDDAYVDFASHAWPILRELQVPATVFVASAYPDHPERSFWWDRLYRCLSQTSKAGLELTSNGSMSLRTTADRMRYLRELRKTIKSLPHAQAMALVEEICSQLDGTPRIQKSVLSWDELRELKKQGVTLGAHTQTHPILTQLPRDRLCQEISGCQEDLQRELGDVLPIFSYPNGSYDDVVLNVLREEGFILAFTMQDGHDNLALADPLRLSRTGITRRTSPMVLRLRLTKVGSYLDRWRHRRGRTDSTTGFNSRAG